ncbi:PI42C kinase, partial [Polyodon spathula]|nr:PI42C kinase [Polyodon spathula]
MLLPDDFKANTKIKVNNHLFNKPASPSVSLARSPPFTGEFAHGDGLFLTSYDKTLVIKQISSEDVADMHSILSDYHQYIVKCHGSTLLPQFLGMYRLSVDSEDTYMLIMRNMFSHRLVVHRKYDLKGSLVSREASDKEKVKELPTFKDMDFLNKCQKVYVDEEQKERFMEKLNRDVDFLVHLKIMDYSLLVGIHDVQRVEVEEEEEVANKEEEELENGLGMVPTVGSYGNSPDGIGGYLSAHKPLGPGEFDPYIDVYAIKSGQEVYFMGLIDILTQYDTKKKAAHAAKTVKHGAGAEISTVNPEQYARRFRDFITNIFA